MTTSRSKGSADTERLDERTKTHLSNYLSDVRNLPNESAKTVRFATLLGALFPDPSISSAFAAGVERPVLRIDTAKGPKRGRIDAYYGNAVIEFENSLKVTGDHAEEQLREYVSGIWQKERSRPLLAIASDGQVWRTYRPRWNGTGKTPKAEEIELEMLREIQLSERTLPDFWIWLTSLIYRPQRTVPTVNQFKIDFGADSPAFRDSIDALIAAWQRVTSDAEPRLAIENWQKYLTVTYGHLPGEGATDPELIRLILKHTYLASIARLLVWASLSKGKFEGTLREVAKEVLSGRFFERYQLANLVEDDFFQWVRRPESEAILSIVWERILAVMQTYDLNYLGEDVLKGVYQELVDPKDRHDLGEYYTPDWLCERMVEALLPASDFVSVLDPTCGSGSFLRAVIRHFVRVNGRKSQQNLLDGILEHVVGIDIHPLAVTISRATYLLALGPLLRAARRPIQIPVYLADSLFLPTEVTQLSLEDQSAGIELKFGGRSVTLPEYLVESPELFDGAIAVCARIAGEHAKTGRESVKTLERYLFQAVPRLEEVEGYERAVIIEALWRFAETLADLIRSKKNSIWAFIIRNTYRPALLKGHFDVVIGNPPWLSYRYIADPEYQDEVKLRAVTEYQIAPESKKLVTQMELATVFLAHCLTTFGRDGARLGFVMPRSVLSADQHVQLRTRAYSAPFRLTGYWDLLGVTPLFNVPACVLFANRQNVRGQMTDVLPVLEWEGKLEERDIPWEQARTNLTYQSKSGRVIFLGDRTAFSTVPGRNKPNAPSPYAPQFRQGATILPRSFYFVRLRNFSGMPDPNSIYWAETDPEQAENAKPPYDDVVMKGQIEGRFLYSTALSKHLMPFAVLSPALITVPVERDGASLEVRTAEQLRKNGYREMATWMRTVERIWRKKREGKAENETVYGWLNYQQKLTNQQLSSRYIVLYNAAGTNVAAATFDRESCDLPFIVEHKLYWLGCGSLEEADYLVAVLNSSVANLVIKPFQSMGLMGERDIEKKVLDLPIPEYSPRITKHRELAALGASARERTGALIKLAEFPNFLPKQRGWVREQLKDVIYEIDRIATQMLELT